MDKQELSVQLVNQQETARAAKKFTRYISSECYFFSYGNDDLKSGEHLEIQKPFEVLMYTYESCSFYLVLIFVFYLATQSL